MNTKEYLKQAFYLDKRINSKLEQVENKELQAILEKRYLCFDSWEKIAFEMNYDIRHIHRLHNRGLKDISSLKLSSHKMS